MSERDPSTSVVVPTEFFDHAPAGFVIVSESGIILKANAKLSDWLGYGAKELGGKDIGHLFSLAGRILYETNVAPLLKLQGKVEEVALDLRTAMGKPLPVIFNAEATATGSDGTTVTNIVVVKAAARKRYERDLVVARTHAQEDLTMEQRQGELREQFVAVLGHDLRNPLASIASAARLLAREPMGARGTQVLELMRGSVNRMSQMIDDILDLARGRLGEGIGVSREVHANLEPMLRQVIEELRTTFPDREIDVQLSTMHPTYCDDGRIGQLLSNLLGNALKHGSEDQPVVVSAETSSDGALILWVSNGGPAVPGEVMARLFDPFVRGDGPESQNGLGLGLYIASEIAKAHGGTLTVTSTSEETRFTFQMPGKHVFGAQ